MSMHPVTKSRSSTPSTAVSLQPSPKADILGHSQMKHQDFHAASPLSNLNK